MENNMHLWEIHSSCSFFHIQEEASNVKWKKPQVCMRDSLFLHLFKYMTEEATDLWKTTSTRYSHTEKKLQIWHGELHIRKIHSSCSFSHTGGKKQQIWNGKTTSTRYPIFTYTGERSFQIFTWTTTSMRRDSPLLVAFYIQEEAALNMTWRKLQV